MDLSRDEIKKVATQTIRVEADAIKNLEGFIGNDFVDVIQLIYKSKGRVIVTGIGKSAIIGEKIVATLNSTGTPAIFMHAADAVHGDLGIIQNEDVILCLSKSGNTAEIKVLIPYIKLMGNKLVGIVGNRESYLAKQADYVIETTVSKEACPNNLAPTSSTTAQLVMGDALSIALLEVRGFSSEDFALYHPGGSLGKQLFLRVSDIYPQNEKPVVDSKTSIADAIIEISSKRLGATAVLENEKLIGVITDGDLRRMMQSGKALDRLVARDIMTKNPKTINSDTLVAHALDIMRRNNITQLPVVDDDVYLGVIHLHDILREGIL